MLGRHRVARTIGLVTRSTCLDLPPASRTGAAAAAFATMLMVACGAPAAPPDTAARTTSLRVATLTDETTLQPYSYVSGYPGSNMLTLIYDTLFILDADNEPRPWVARRDVASADGLTHTLTLRDDVQWHDGRALTSGDVKFTYEFYQAHTHGRWTPPVRNIVTIETPDATTVVLRLREPDPSFAMRLLADVPIIPRHVWSGVTAPKTFAGRIGSGPFRLADYRPDQFYRFTANREHFSGAPAVDELLMSIIKDPATVFAALESGEIHATTLELAPELVSRFQTRAGLKVTGGLGYSTTLLQFNTERAPWNQAVVRQAVALAIDTQQFVDTLLLGSEAGGVPMAPVLLVQSNNPTRVRAAELIRAAVRAIGIDARVQAQEAGSLTDTVWPDFDVTQGRDYDWTMFGWSAPMLVDPLRIVSLVDSDTRYGTNNIGGYHSAEADAIAARLRVTLDAVVQRDLVRRLERVIARDRPFVRLWYPNLTYAHAPEAYDRWVFQKGQGLFNRLSFLRTVAP